jgi:two-component system, sensor histidine kinase and response regulator
LEEVNKLDIVMDDFHKFFNNKKSKENVNIKVSLDSVLFSLKEEMNKQNININIEGNNLLSLNIVIDEIKHIFNKLISKSLENFKLNNVVQNKQISISFEDSNQSIFIIYKDNANSYDDEQIEKFFLTPCSLKHNNFDLGFYLVKVFVEKNFGLLSVEKTQDGIKYIIRFDK